MLPTGLTLSLGAAEYFVTEGLALRVCVVLVSGETERVVTFDTTLGGGSASSMFTVLELKFCKHIKLTLCISPRGLWLLIIMSLTLGL